MQVQSLELDGKDYVVLPRAEYERLTILAKAADLPALPEADKNGNFPAVEYARASIARDLIRERSNAGLSQRELARRAGVRFETICRIETAKHTPSIATLRKIEQALAANARQRLGPSKRSRPSKGFVKGR